MLRSIRTTAIATMAAATVAAGLGAVGAAPASAETVAPLSRCWGVSPNIVDQPFSVARLFLEPDGAGRVIARVRDVSSLWALLSPAAGYDSVGRLDWHNVSNGRKGTAIDTARIGGYVNGQQFRLATGAGTVRVTYSAVNRNALWAIPSTSCGGTLTVR
ncbi:hypothetical protein [Gordonia soli]|uniref:Peptidase C30 domain-containing protein n=1 Tax=Gordonia soli NBRC 108243 TaxID=1223545 RepID=M0QIK2_9ACTN|nr:hypothetical protein [Gordonia soli]GAC68440.1 hypothetical protein GS4_15_00900 [Gordonia soli NBRC 108243]